MVRGRSVTLDGSRSMTAETYSWRQVSGPAVTLTGATSARPTFTYPAQALPATPGPNAAFVFDNNPVVLELTVRNPAGTATDQVVIRSAGGDADRHHAPGTAPGTTSGGSPARAT